MHPFISQSETFTGWLIPGFCEENPDNSTQQQGVRMIESMMDKEKTRALFEYIGKGK